MRGLITLIRWLAFIAVILSLVDMNYAQHKEKPRKETVIVKTIPRKENIFFLAKRLFFEQINDARNTYNRIKTLLNNSIEDDKKKPKKLKVVASTTPKPAEDAETTTAAYRIRKDELQRILLRNLRGILRLYNQELAIANKQSKITQREFNKELRNSIKMQLS